MTKTMQEVISELPDELKTELAISLVIEKMNKTREIETDDLVMVLIKTLEEMFTHMAIRKDQLPKDSPPDLRGFALDMKDHAAVGGFLGGMLSVAGSAGMPAIITDEQLIDTILSVIVEVKQRQMHGKIKAMVANNSKKASSND